MKIKLLGFLVLTSVIAVGLFVVHHNRPKVENVARPQQNANSNKSPQPAFNKAQYSNTDPTSIWVVVNKQRALRPANYTPTITVPRIPLRLSAASSEMYVSSSMAPALEQLVGAAKSAGYSLILASGYRSYSLQVSVYNNEVKTYGQAKADQESARPGYSEHQTGLAADLEPSSRTCEVSQCFANLPEGKWLAANAYKYGFIIRYPDGKERVTGYEYEPWHVRYVGIPLATEMRNTGIQTLEEFFDLPAAPNY